MEEYEYDDDYLIAYYEGDLEVFSDMDEEDWYGNNEDLYMSV